MKNGLLTLMVTLSITGIAVKTKAYTGEPMTDYSQLEKIMKPFIDRKMREHRIPGLTIAIVDDQKIIWSNSFGYADLKNKRKTNTNTQFRAGSITKVFTAIAIMQLTQQGKVDIDKPLKTYLPQFKINSRHGNTDNITIRSILSHTSGLPSEYVDGMWEDIPYKSDTPYIELVDLIQNEYVSYPPYTAFSYSNIGPTLLGHLIHNVSGLSYQEYIKKNILQPLTMSRSDIRQTINGENIALSYTQNSNSLVKELALRYTPAGGLNSTVNDLSKLVMMVNAKGKYADTQLLKTGILQNMFIKPKMHRLNAPTSHGIGWMVEDSTPINGEHQLIIGHEGATIGHSSQLKIAVDTKLGVVVMANKNGNSTGEIIDHALKHAHKIKTGKKVSKEKYTINHCITPDIEDAKGSYVLPDYGLITIEPENKKWIVNAFGIKMHLQQQNGLYGFKYKWLGVIPIKLDELDHIGLCFQRHDNNTYMDIYYKGQPLGTAQKVSPTKISEAWNKRIGHYQMDNAHKFIKAIESSNGGELALENGLLIMKSDNSPVKSVLIPVNDNQAIIAGYGRLLGETVRIESDGYQEFLILSGTTLKKVVKKHP